MVCGSEEMQSRVANTGAAQNVLSSGRLAGFAPTGVPACVSVYYDMRQTRLLAVPSTSHAGWGLSFLRLGCLMQGRAARREAGMPKGAQQPQ